MHIYIYARARVRVCVIGFCIIYFNIFQEWSIQHVTLQVFVSYILISVFPPTQSPLLVSKYPAYDSVIDIVFLQRTHIVPTYQ